MHCFYQHFLCCYSQSLSIAFLFYLWNYRKDGKLSNLRNNWYLMCEIVVQCFLRALTNLTNFEPNFLITANNEVNNGIPKHFYCTNLHHIGERTRTSTNYPHKVLQRCVAIIPRRSIAYGTSKSGASQNQEWHFLVMFKVCDAHSWSLSMCVCMVLWATC